MFHACAVRFDVMENLVKSFGFLDVSKQALIHAETIQGTVQGPTLPLL